MQESTYILQTSQPTSGTYSSGLYFLCQKKSKNRWNDAQKCFFSFSSIACNKYKKIITIIKPISYIYFPSKFCYHFGLGSKYLENIVKILLLVMADYPVNHHYSLLLVHPTFFSQNLFSQLCFQCHFVAPASWILFQWFEMHINTTSHLHFCHTFVWLRE